MADVVKKTIKIEGIVDVKDVIHGIEEIQGALSKLQLKPDTKAGFDKIFQDIERQAEKANAAMATGFKNKGDVKHYTDALRQIDNAYNAIILRVEKLKGQKDIKFNFDTEEVKNIKNDLANLTKVAEQAATQLEAAGKALGKSAKIKDIESRRGGKGGQWADILGNLNPENIDKAIKKIEELRERADKSLSENKAVTYWTSVKKDLEEIQTEINNYNGALQAQSDAQDKVTKKTEELNVAMHNVGGELDVAANAAKNGSKEFNSYAKSGVEAANSTQQLNSELDHFKSKAAYFFGLSNAINLFKRSLRSAYETVKDLDAVMTETAVVTNFDVGDMWSQLPEYTQRANELGVSIHSAYEAATIFYQQGLKTNEVMAVSNETLKMARIAGLDAATASDRMTNALRGFNMEMDKVSAQRVNDVYSKLAAITASNTDEISTAMTKVASLAHNANMEFETTSAFLAQMIETTRESAETAGTALKTVVARFSEVKKLYSKGELLGQDEEGGEIDVNKVSTALRSAGINLNEYLTGTKGLDDIFIELASKWDSLDKVQQRYIATMAAGSRQQSRFIAMMSDYSRTMELVDAANNANGASQEQYAKTLESLQTKLSRLKNAWDEFILGLANSDVIKGAVDALTDLITAINTLIKAISNKNAIAKMVTTFFTAFTAFKIGQKMFGGTQIGKFFNGLTQTAGEEGKKGAATFIGNFYKNLGSKINSGDIKNAFSKSFNDIKGTIGDVYQYFNPRQIAGLMPDVTKDEAITNIINKFDTNTTTSEQMQSFKNAIGPEIENGTLTLDKLNKALKDSGQNFKVSAKDAEKFGLVVGDNNGTVESGTAALRRFSAGAVLVGTAMIAAGEALENSESSFSSLGPLLKVAGVAVVTFGTLMSVWLPLQAQLGATKLSATIFGIPIIGWIAAVISAVLALGAAFLTWKKSTSFETRMKNATEACKNAADAADEATKAYEKLGEAWDSLNDKYAAINNAVAGTQQWRDAIKAANDEVLNLVNSYEDLDVVVGDDGRLIITEESKEAVQNNLRAKKESAQAASIGAQLNKNRIQAELSQQKKDSWSLTGMGAETWKIGNEEFNEDKVKQKVIEQYNKGQIKSTEDLQKYVHTLMPSSTIGLPVYDKIRDYEFNALKEYAKDKSFSEQSQAQFNGLASNALTGLSNQDAIKYAKNLVNAKSAEEIYNKELKRNQGNELSKKQKLQKFAENSGYSNYAEWKEQANNGKDIKEEDLDSRLAAQEAQEKLTRLASQFETKFGNLTSEQLKYFQQEGGGALTAKDFDEIRKKGSAREIVNRIGDKEYFENLGIDREGYITQLQKELDEAEKYVTIKSGSILEGLGENVTKNLTASVGKSLTENFESVFIGSGQEGVNTLQKQIKSLTDDMDPEKAKAFTAALSKIDWTSTNSIHSLSDLVAEYGIADDRIEALENDIVKFNNASLKVDLSKLTDQLKSLLKIGNGIKTGTQGRSFNEEDYKKLIEQAGMNADKFVYNIETGEYNYTGQLGDILDAVNKLVDNSFNTEQLEKDIASGQVAQDLFSKNGSIDNVKDKSSFVKDYIEQAGENSKIKSMAWSQAYDDIRLKNDYSAMNKLYEMIKNDKNKLGENEAALNTTKFNAEVMRAQMKSGVENAFGATQGGEISSKALQAQLSSSGLPEKIKQELLSSIQGDNEEDKKNAATQAGHIVDTFAQAKANGISVEDLNAYADALTRVEGLENKRVDELYAIALAEAKYNEGMKSLVSSYDDWSKLIDKKGGGFKIPQPDTAAFKVYAKMKEDVEKMLNSSEKIPDEFFKSEKNAKLLQKAVKGSKKAAAELAANLAKINIGNLGTEKDTDQAKKWVDEIQKKLPDLKIGTTFDENSIEVKLAQLLASSGKTVDEINKIMGNIGMGIEWEAKEVDVASYMESHQGGSITVPDGDGTKTIPVNDLTKYETNGKAQILMPKKATFNKPPKITKPTTKKKSSGGGGKKSKAKKERWENPYDELYNLQEKINEALRKREALERRYQKLLKQQQTSLKDIRAAYYDQIKHMKTEANLQKQLAEGRLNQINKLGKDTYVTSKGKVKTFEQMGVTKYAKYNQETGEIQIDWSGINKLEGTKHVETGKAVEAYISKLEELVKGYEDTRDALWDIEDKIEDLRQQVIETYLTFEDRVLDALVTKYQRQIDSYQAMSDAIDKINNEVLKSLREQVELSRQIRDNTKKEEDISKKENRLAYLRRDTSGANDLEILSLEKELKEAREGYSDDLVDQTIDKLQKDVDQASEQRERQIEVMQAQLDIMEKTGALWDEAHKLLREANEQLKDLNSDEEFAKQFKLTDLAKLLAKSEDISSLSDAGFLNWLDKALTDYRQAGLGKEELEKKYGIDVDKDGKIDTEPEEPMVESSVAERFENRDERNAGIAIGAKLGGYGWSSNATQLQNQLKDKGFDENDINEILMTFRNFNKNDPWKKIWPNLKLSNYSIDKFARGGLADYTGPAWLDGTKTNPELVLNAQDTRNFIALKDILSSLMSTPSASTKTSSGDNYFDINITADIGSDYDVDKLANRIKKQIFEDSQYRNVNTINYLR